MKGLTHFMSGAAVASFFPHAVQLAHREAASSFILVLGGFFGIMPDTLDFKVGQFFSKADYDVETDPNHPDPQKMAEGIGKAMDEAFETGRYVKVQLYPIRMGADLWRQYVIKFDGEKNEVTVVINQIVTTSQVPYLGTEPKENRLGRYRLKGKMLDTHGRPSVVDIMSGPQYGFRKTAQGEVEVEFLPWHRTWSHSYLLGLFLSIPVWLIASLIAGWSVGWLYGLIAFLGFAIHLTEDLTGHMGGSLFWPFQKTRSNGLAWFKASNPHANFSVDYTSAVIIIYNLNRFAAEPVFSTNPFSFFLYSWFLPMLVYFAITKIFGKKGAEKKIGVVEAEKAIQQEELAYEETEMAAGDAG